MHRVASVALVAAAASLAACSAPSHADRSLPSAFQGNQSVLVQMSFDAEVDATDADGAKSLINGQLNWLLGEFHQLGGDPRLTWAQITTTGTQTKGALTAVTYHVSMPVAWPSAVAVPATYEVVLPKVMDDDAQRAFYTKIKDTCLDDGVEDDTDWSNAWFDFAPNQTGCKLDPADVVRATAQIAPGAANTRGTYPEYDRIWSDGKFNAVAVFGLDDPTSKSSSDLGAQTYRAYVDGLKSASGLANVTDAEESFDDDGNTVQQATIDGQVDDTHPVHVVAFLVVKASYAGDAFATRYNAATAAADFVGYSGHAGLGGNIQKLQSLGVYQPGQWQLFLFDGCDTYAYIDQTLFNDKRNANGGAANDPDGTRDMNVVLNALPTPWPSGDPSILKLTRALFGQGTPVPYDQILRMFPDEAHPVVIGDESNSFQPSGAAPSAGM